MPTQLEQLKEYTIVVSDTGDVNAVKRLQPQDGTTNPSLIYKAAKMEEYAPLIDNAVEYGKGDLGLVMVSNILHDRETYAQRKDPSVYPSCTHAHVTLPSLALFDTHRTNWPSILVPKLPRLYPAT